MIVDTSEVGTALRDDPSININNLLNRSRNHPNDKDLEKNNLISPVEGKKQHRNTQVSFSYEKYDKKVELSPSLPLLFLPKAIFCCSFKIASFFILKHQRKA